MSRRYPSALFALQVHDVQYYCPELSRSARPLEVVCAGWEDCRSDYDLVRRSFQWFGVELIARGAGWVELDGDRHPLRTGTVFCYGPTTSLRITADRQHPFLKYFVIFAGGKPRHAVASGPLRINGVLQALYPHELWRDIVGAHGYVICLRRRRTDYRVPHEHAAYYFPEHDYLGRLVRPTLGAAEDAYGECIDVRGVVCLGFSQGSLMGALVLGTHPREFSRALLIEGGGEY